MIFSQVWRSEPMSRSFPTTTPSVMKYLSNWDAYTFDKSSSDHEKINYKPDMGIWVPSICSPIISIDPMGIPPPKNVVTQQVACRSDHCIN